MHTGIVHPFGPSSHFWINFGSVWARYTASGGAVKCLVTINWVSPSVLSVILLIVFFLYWFFSSLVFPSPPELRRGGCSLSPGRFAAWQAIGPSLQYPYSRDDEDASCPQLGERSVLHLRAPSGAARLRVVSSRTALPIH